MLCPDRAVAAGGKVCVGAGQRVAPGERVERRPAWPGPDAGPGTAAAEPRELGHLRRDERGAPVRGDGPGGGGAAAGRDGGRRDRRDRAGKGRGGHRWSQAPVHGVRGPGGQRDQHRAPVLRAGQDRARADRRPAVDPPRAHRRPGEVPAHGPAARSGVPHQGTAGHRHLHGRVRRRHRLRLRLRRRGLRQLHPAARVLRDPRPGVRAARAIKLHPHPGRRHQNDLRAGRQGAAEGQAALGDPLRRPRLQGPALVRLGLDRHRQPAPPPAGPPPPQDRGPGLPLLLGARHAGPDQGPADPRRRAQMAHRRRFRVQQGLLRARPVPGPALHRDRPPHRAGHGRPGHLRHHRRPGQRPHRHPGTAPGPGRSAAARRSRHDPADHPGDQATARRPHHPAPSPMARHPLGRMDPPPPSPLTMVPQTHQTRPRRRTFPAQPAKCGCLTRLPRHRG